MSLARVGVCALLLMAPAWGQQAPDPAPHADATPQPDAAPNADAAPQPDAAPAEDSTGAYVDPNDGLGWRDDGVELRLRALIAADYRHYDRRNVRDRDPRLDRALLGAEAELLDDLLRVRVLADLRATDTDGLEEAWLLVDPTRERLIRLSAGLLKQTIGIEAGLPEETLPLLDHGLPDRLTSRHDYGARLDGELLDGLLSWDVTLGAGEGFDANGQRLDDPQLSATLTAYPFRWLDDVVEVAGVELRPLSGLFLHAGAAHSWGWSSSFEIPNAFRNKLVVSPRLEADRRQYYQFGAGLDLGPLRVIYEFARGSLLGLDTTRGSQDLDGDFSSWALSVALRIGGPGFDSRPLRQWEARRQAPFTSVADGGFGMIELGARYANAEWDRDLFTPLGFIPIVTGGRDPLGQGGSSQEFRTLEGSLTWIPLRPVRFGVHVIRVIADQFPGVFDSHGRDTSLAIRLQVDL